MIRRRRCTDPSYLEMVFVVVVAVLFLVLMLLAGDP